MAKVHVRVQSIEDKMFEYVENHGIEIYIDYNDGFTKEQMEMLIQGKKDEVVESVEEWANGNGYDGEFDSYWQEMCDELKCTMDDVQDWLGGTESIYPWYYLDEHGYKQLLRNSRAYITATVEDACWNFNNWAYGEPLEYNDVKVALKLLNVNPKEFRDLCAGGSATSGPGKVKGYFPNMPNRKAAVNVKDLYDNLISLYDGQMCFCLTDLDDVAEVAASDSKNIVFKKGTNVVMYEFGGGAGITDVQLLEDITIPRKMVSIDLDDSYRYGIQECYGFTRDYWEAGGIQNGK